MHSYTVDIYRRRLIYVALAFFGALAAWVVNLLFTKAKLTMPWWLDAPAALGFFGIFSSFFNRCLWRTLLLRRIGVVTTPDLRGDWKAEVCSSYYDGNHIQHGVANITQTWTRILISLHWQESHSVSTAAMLDRGSDGLYELTYTFLNEPVPTAISTMQTHRGTSVLVLDSEGNTLEGSYYSGRGRQNVGTLKLTRRKNA